VLYSFELHVTRNGKPYIPVVVLGPEYGLFAAQALVKELGDRFPQVEGFSITVSLIPAKREVLTAANFLTLKPGQRYLPPGAEAPAEP
jgi:hypothetical protein